MISLVETQWNDGAKSKPVMSVLEVRDKNALEQEPIAWIFLERIEKYELEQQTGEVREASIQISYQLIHDRRNFRAHKSCGEFGGCYSSYYQMVSLTSTSMGGSAVFLSLPGLEGNRIGTYLMTEIVEWAKAWPDADIKQISLIQGQATDDNKVRRNRFYERFGLTFSYSDQTQASGLSQPMKVSDLKSVESWTENITEINPIELIAEILKQLHLIKYDVSSKTRLLNEFKVRLDVANRNPICWAIKTLWHKNYYRSINIVILVGIGAVIFLNWNS